MIKYKGKWFSVVGEKVKLPNGKIAEWEKVVTNDFVMIVPIVDKDNLLILRQYRPVLKKWFYELPAGRINKGENPTKCAKRELEEETGHRSNQIKQVCKAYSSNGLTTEMGHYFIARNLIKSTQKLDEHEVLQVKKIKISKALEMIKNGKIVEAHTIMALLLLQNKK